MALNGLLSPACRDINARQATPAEWPRIYKLNRSQGGKHGFLKALFGDSALTFDQLVNAIQTYNGKAENKDKQIKIGNIGDGSYVSSDKFKAKEAELTTANTTIKNLQGEIKKWDGVDVDKLKTAVADWETKYNQDTAKSAQTALLRLRSCGQRLKPKIRAGFVGRS